MVAECRRPPCPSQPPIQLLTAGHNTGSEALSISMLGKCHFDSLVSGVCGCSQGR